MPGGLSNRSQSRSERLQSPTAPRGAGAIPAALEAFEGALKRFYLPSAEEVSEENIGCSPFAARIVIGGALKPDLLAIIEGDGRNPPLEISGSLMRRLPETQIPLGHRIQLSGRQAEHLVRTR